MAYENLDKINFFVRISIWASLIAVGAFIAIPISVVPITLQTFFIILAGFKEGSAIAFYATLLYFLAGLLGLPVFAGGVAGPAILMVPTLGFYLAFPVAALISGLAKNKSFYYYIGFGVLASLIILFGGAVGLMLRLSFSVKVAFLAVLPFCLGDSLKIIAATLICYKKNDTSK